ncbi:MAG: hypothetical protein GYB58_06110 [Gammaproteobacteria bacterium]|nr:hypothetical protein [Gammaproteobacteria bacterium]
MEIVLIPLGIIAFFLFLPFALAKWTVSEKTQNAHLAIGFKSALPYLRSFLGIGLMPLLAMIWSFDVFDNQYLSAAIFSVTFYALGFMHDETKACFRTFRQFRYLTHGYVVSGALVCLFVFNLFGGLILVLACLYWFLQCLIFLGKSSAGETD